MIKSLRAALVCLALIEPTFAGTTSQADLSHLTHTLSLMRARSPAPGLAVVAVENGQLLFVRGFGVRDVRTHGLVDGNTVFTLGSLTKAFTVALLGTLVDSGVMSWDDPVAAHLPEFQMYGPFETRDVRVRDVLSHQTGLGTLAGDQLYVGAALPWEEILRRIRYFRPTAPLRAKFQYNNLAYVIAGLLYERVANESWSAGLRNKLFTPLDMRSSFPLLKEVRDSAHLATPHVLADDGTLTPVPFDSADYVSLDTIGPAGGILSCADDLGRWITFLLAKGWVGNRHVLSSDVINAAQTSQITLDGQNSIAGHPLGYGLGWFISDYRGVRLIHHSGGGIGINSFIALVPEQNIGVAVLTNYAPAYLQYAAGYTVLDLLLGLHPMNWEQRFRESLEREQKQKKAQPTALQVANTMPSHALSAYTGQYSDPSSGPARVYIDNNHLVFAYNPRFVGDLRHWHYDTFEITWRNPEYDTPRHTLLTFQTDDRGHIASLQMQFYFDTVQFFKVGEALNYGGN